MARGRDAGCDAREKLERREDSVGLVLARLFDPIRDSTIA
jgi:hypothetical protein